MNEWELTDKERTEIVRRCGIETSCAMGRDIYQDIAPIIATAAQKKLVECLVGRVEMNFVVYANETTVVEDRVALPIEFWSALKDALEVK